MRYGIRWMGTWPHVSLGVSAHLWPLKFAHLSLHNPLGVLILGYRGDDTTDMPPPAKPIAGQALRHGAPCFHHPPLHVIGTERDCLSCSRYREHLGMTYEQARAVAGTDRSDPRHATSAWSPCGRCRGQGYQPATGDIPHRAETMPWESGAEAARRQSRPDDQT